MEGKIVAHFRIIREIGRGGMGVVYLAHDQKLNRKVAIKFIKKEYSNREALLKEAQLASQINHPGVVTIFEVIDTSEGLGIVMEYVEGESLANFLRTHRVNFPFALRLAKQLIKILAYAHQNNLIHGDLKPANIIITPEGQLKLLDFGLSRLLSVQEDGAAFSGTFPYVSPEQIIGSPPTEQTDIYALGLILFQLFTGRLPFEKENQAAQIYAIVHEPAPDPLQFRKNLPPIISRIILRCLEKDPVRRYSSVKTLLSDIETIIPEEVKESRRISPKLLLTNVFIFGIIFMAILYLFLKVGKTPVNVQSLEEIQLHNPVKIGIEYTVPDGAVMESQMRLMGLAELLSEQFRRIPGVNLIYSQKRAHTFEDVQIPSNPVDFIIRFSLKKTKINYLLNGAILNSRGEPINRYSFSWNTFDDILWISKKILTRAIRSFSGEEIVLADLPENIWKNVMAYQHLSYGLFHFREKNYRSAINSFQRAIALNPFFIRAHYYNGLSFYYLGKYEKAIDEFFEAMPEVSKQNTIDWIEPLNLDSNEIHDLKPILGSEENEEHSLGFSYVYSQKKSILRVFGIEAHDTYTITLPEECKGSYIAHIHQYNNKLIFILSPVYRKKFRFATYEPELKKWHVFPGISNSEPVVRLPYIDYIDQTNTRIARINVDKPVEEREVKIPALPFKKLFDLQSSDFRIAMGDSILYVIDFKRKKYVNLFKRLEMQKRDLKFFLFKNNYFCYLRRGENNLHLYNLCELKDEEIFPLLINDEYGFGFSTRFSGFSISTRFNTFYVLKPDTHVYVYKIIPEGGIKMIGKFDLRPYPGVYRPYRGEDKFPQKDFVLYNKERNAILILNPQRAPNIQLIKPEKNFILIALNLDKTLFLLNDHNIVALNKKTGQKTWDLNGKFLPVHVIPQKYLIIFTELNGNRLAFYQYSSQQFWGYYQFTSRKKVRLQCKNKFIFFVENNFFKRLNTDILQQSDPIHLSNIYKHISECYYRLGEYQKAQVYSEKVLDELKETNYSMLLLQIKICIRNGEIMRAIRLLSGLYNILPEHHPYKQALKNMLVSSGLYLWETPVNLFQGIRYFEANEKAVVFSDAKPGLENQLWILDPANGKVKKKITFYNRFSGLLLPSHKLLYACFDSLSKRYDYNLLDLSKGELQKKIEGTFSSEFPPKFIKGPPGKIVTFYMSLKKQLGSIELVNLKTDEIRNIFLSFNNWCEPLLTNGNLLFLSGDSLYSYHISTGEMSTKYLNLKGKKPARILQITPTSLIFANRKNRVYKWTEDSNRLKHLYRIKFFVQPNGFYTNRQKLILMKDNRIREINLSDAIQGQAVQIQIMEDKLFILEPDNLVLWKDGKIVNLYPLLQNAIKMVVVSDTAYILSVQGTIYAVNLNWHPSKLKKDLILSLN